MHSMWRFALLTALVGLVLPSPAHACKCMRGEEVFPPAGNVPPNVAFHVRNMSEKLVLVDEIGTPVPLQVEEVGFRLTRLRPGTPLEDGKLYTLRAQNQEDEWGGQRKPLGLYQVHGSPDTQPPSPPASSDFQYESGISMQGTSCETQKMGYSVSISGAADDRASDEQLAIALVSASAPEQLLGMLLPTQRKFLGKDVCLYNFDLRKAQEAPVALRSVDLAGNLSAPGAPFSLSATTATTPEQPVQGPPTRLLLLLAVLVPSLIGVGLFVARRSRRQGKPSA